jgi:hypothetical protein
MDLNDDLRRQIAEEMKELEPNSKTKSTLTMLQQKYGLLRPLFDQEELEIVNG